MQMLFDEMGQILSENNNIWSLWGSKKVILPFIGDTFLCVLKPTPAQRYAECIRNIINNRDTVYIW